MAPQYRGSQQKPAKGYLIRTRRRASGERKVFDSQTTCIHRECLHRPAWYIGRELLLTPQERGMQAWCIGTSRLETSSSSASPRGTALRSAATERGSQMPRHGEPGRKTRRC